MMIRRAQLEAMERSRQDNFYRRLMVHLRTHFTERLEDLPDWELGEAIEESISRASSYGLESERDLARFSALAVCFGWTFDVEMSWPRTTLLDSSRAPSLRLRSVYERCLQDLEMQAQVVAAQGNGGS